MSKFITGPAGLINTRYITKVTPFGSEEWIAHMHDGNQHVLSTAQMLQLVPDGLNQKWVDNLRNRWAKDAGRGF